MNTEREVVRHADLVYDVGAHQGEDTEFYLKKGFRVVGFEANPALVEQCRARFAGEIADGRLVLVEGAILDTPRGDPPRKTVPFYRNKNVSVWGTVAPGWAARNERLGTSNDVIEVPVVDFAGCLRAYGIPHYLKIDIEGMDSACLEALAGFAAKPDYVSIESDKLSFGELTAQFELLARLGYTRFKAVQQHRISRQREPNPTSEGRYVGHPFAEGSSGLFGADVPGPWDDYDRIIKRYRAIFLQYRLFGDYGALSRYFAGRVVRKLLSIATRSPIPGWYDTHARHGSLRD